MSLRKPKPNAAREDAAVAWARRRETQRAVLKMMRVLLRAVKRHADWVRDRHGIDSTQLWALSELARAPGMRGVELARDMAIHRHRAEQLLRELLERGLVRVEAGPDRPSPMHFLTPDGRRIAERAPEHAQGVMLSALDRLSDTALDQAVSALSDLVEQLPR